MRGLLAAVVVAAIGCGHGERSSAVARSDCAETFGEHATFALDPVALRAQGASKRLLEKMARSPHAYFRALARPYELRTCAAFRDERARLPMVAVHGDAHVEQFVVTPTTAALEDFDQSGFGPAIVDLVRYSSSLHLVCKSVRFACNPERMVGVYLDAYREALDLPPRREPVRIAERLRRETSAEPGPWLRWAESSMQPLSTDQEVKVRRGWEELRQSELEIHPDRGRAFYDIVRVGAIQIGVGSALETKVLLRLRGPSDDPNDDLVVEARSGPPSADKECIARPLHGGSLQPLFFMALLGPRMPEVYGFATMGEGASGQFWLQSWVAGYRELAIDDLRDEAELAELAQDAGRQLAGHFWGKFPEPLRAVQRRAQLAAFDTTRARVATLSKELAVETVREWERFRAAAQP